MIRLTKVEKTPKQQLLELGMQEDDFDTHMSDLYVRANEISSKWLETYEFKNGVKTFLYNKYNEYWFDIPFGYFEEYVESKPFKD